MTGTSDEMPNVGTQPSADEALELEPASRVGQEIRERLERQADAQRQAQRRYDEKTREAMRKTRVKTGSLHFR